MSCGCCSSGEEGNKVQYKCAVCGAIYAEPKECCGEPAEKLCNCGSGEYEKDCCKE